MPSLDIDRLTATATNLAKDALYVGVGATLLGFQRAQVQRRELEKNMQERMGVGREQVQNVTGSMSKTVEEQVRTLDERVGALETHIDGVLDQVQARLPEPARDLLAQAREAAKTARAQVRQLVVPAA